MLKIDIMHRLCRIQYTWSRLMHRFDRNSVLFNSSLLDIDKISDFKRSRINSIFNIPIHANFIWFYYFQVLYILYLIKTTMKTYSNRCIPHAFYWLLTKPWLYGLDETIRSHYLSELVISEDLGGFYAWTRRSAHFLYSNLNC